MSLSVEQGIEQQAVGDFLHYGHTFCASLEHRSGRAHLPDEVRAATRGGPFRETADELVGMGVQALQETFVGALDEFDPLRNRTHVVPLSSGLDSRTILAGLLGADGISRDQIRTVTFGTPGSWDFDVGRAIANTVGVDNVAVDLTAPAFRWDLEELYDYAASQEAPNKFFEGYVNASLSRVVDAADPVFWSGVMGDAVAGKETTTTPEPSWADACRSFAAFNRLTDARLRPPGYDPTAALPAEPWLPRDRLTYRDQLTLGVERPCFLEPLIVSPDHAHRYVRVFLRPEWLSFVLRVPRELRARRNLFKRIVRAFAPDLFAFPTDAANGQPIGSPKWRVVFGGVTARLRMRVARRAGIDVVDPWVNYLDFDAALRRDTPLRATVHELVDRFDDRELLGWLDAAELRRAHQRGDGSELPLRLVASLELYLATH